MPIVDIQVFDTPTATARAAAEHMAAAIRAAQRERGRAAIAVSGGSTPGTMLAALAAMPLPWAELCIFQVDERVAPAGHEDRNLTQLQSALGSGHPDAVPAIRAMPVEAAANGIERETLAACRAYEQTIEAATGQPPTLDLIHLGMGGDGHTASLFPGDRLLEERRAEVACTEGEHAGYRRMTLTYPMLERARETLWLLAGASKQAMLRRLVAGDRSIPAGRLQAVRTTIFADAAAYPRAQDREA